MRTHRHGFLCACYEVRAASHRYFRNLAEAADCKIHVCSQQPCTAEGDFVELVPSYRRRRIWTYKTWPAVGRGPGAPCLPGSSVLSGVEGSKNDYSIAGKNFQVPLGYRRSSGPITLASPHPSMTTNRVRVRSGGRDCLPGRSGGHGFGREGFASFMAKPDTANQVPREVPSPADHPRLALSLLPQTLRRIMAQECDADALRSA